MEDNLPQETLEQSPAQQQESEIENGRLIYSYQQKTHFGPIPSPEELAKYNEVVPGSAEIIINAFNDQVHHRIKSEEMLVKSNVQIAKRGQIIGAAMAVLFGGLGAVFTFTGHEYIAGGIFTVLIGSVVAAFVAGRSKEKEAKEKNK